MGSLCVSQTSLSQGRAKSARVRSHVSPQLRSSRILRPALLSRHSTEGAQSCYRLALWHAGGGLATFPMRFNAIVFRPFKGEVFDAVVTQVNKLGFFAQVGPLQVFVSKHLIPSDMRFDPQSTPASYVSEVSDEQPQRVSKDSEVRWSLPYRASFIHPRRHVCVPMLILSFSHPLPPV